MKVFPDVPLSHTEADSESASLPRSLRRPDRERGPLGFEEAPMMRLRSSPFPGWILALYLAVSACGGPSHEADATVETVVVVEVAQVGVPLSTIVIEVSGANVPPGLVFNLTISANGVASGILALPVGSARTLTVRAYDSTGAITHEGMVTIDVVPGTNPSVSIPMVPRPGEKPINVHVGPVTIVIEPASPTVAVGATAPLSATVRAADGSPVTAPVRWASTDPALATVDEASGVVTGVATGTATIVASYAGTAASIQVVVTP